MKHAKFFPPRDGKFPRALLALILVAFTCAPPAAVAQSLDLDRERCRIMLREIKNDIKEKYYDAAYRGMNVEERFKAADEKLKQAKSRGQMFAVIAQALVEWKK